VKEQKAIDYATVKGFNEIVELILQYGGKMGIEELKNVGEKTSVEKSNAMTREEAMKNLKEIKELLDIGVLTQDEFDAKKQEYMQYL
jgi:hypothetical protein